MITQFLRQVCWNNLDADVCHALHSLNKHVDVNLAFHNSEQKLAPPVSLLFLTTHRVSMDGITQGDTQQLLLS